MKQNVKCLKVIGLHNVGVKNKYSSLDNYMKIYIFKLRNEGYPSHSCFQPFH